MIDANQAITIVSVILGSGLVQFLLTRKDKKQEDAKKDNADTIKKDMKDHLTEVNNKWKEDYCDNRKGLFFIMGDFICSHPDKYLHLPLQ